MCEAKANLYEDREVRVIDRWQPTSQSCSSCGYKWGKLDLSVREIVCLGCGESHCRDSNAAKNIEAEGRRTGIAMSHQSLGVGVGHTHDHKRTQRKRKTVSTAIFSEASTHKLEYEQLSLF